MKRLFFLSLIFTLFYSFTVFGAINYPEDFNYAKAKKCITDNATDYGEGHYWVSRYPYTGNDDSLQGQYQQNYKFDAPVFTVGWYTDAQKTVFNAVAISTEPFHTERYGMNNTYVSNSSLQGNNQVAAYFDYVNTSSTTAIGQNADVTDFFRRLEQNWYHYSWGTQVSNLESQYQVNFKIYDTFQDFVDALYEENYNMDSNGDPPNYDPLNPFRDPYFYLKVTSPTYTPNIEYTITWDTSNSWANPQSDYAIQVYVSKSTNDQTGDFFNSWSTKKAIKSTDQYPITLDQVAFSFTLQELRNMYLFGGGFLDHNFYIYIRVVDADTGRASSPRWKAFQVTKMYEVQSSFGQTEGIDGEPGDKEYYTERNDQGGTDYIDGRETGDNTDGQGNQSQNGSSVSPQGSENGISNTTPTNGQENGINYGTSLNDLSSNLSGLVSTIGSLPYVMMQVLNFLPAWVVTLISVSLGMIVVIGTVKLILK